MTPLCRDVTYCGLTRGVSRVSQRGIRLLRLLSALRAHAFSAQRKKRIRRASHITGVLGGALATSRTRLSRRRGTQSQSSRSPYPRPSPLASPRRAKTPRGTASDGRDPGSRLGPVTNADTDGSTNPIAAMRLEGTDSPAGQAVQPDASAVPDPGVGVRDSEPLQSRASASPSSPPALTSGRTQGSGSGRLSTELRGAAGRMYVADW